MNEMKERAVRAITEEFESGRRVFNDGEAEALVRVVMEAMREPTSKMLLRANRLPASDSMHFGDLTKIWQVMVDEAGK